MDTHSRRSQSTSGCRGASGLCLRFLLVLSFLLLPDSVDAQGIPDAKTILGHLKYSEVHLSQPLAGRLKLQNGQMVPFTLTWSGPEVVFQFKNPTEILRLNLSETDSTLTQQTDQHFKKITGSKFLETVRNSDLTYEDLAMRFLYWPQAKVESEQTIRNIACWVLLVQPPTRNSNYGSVRLWIPKEEGFFLRAETFDTHGKLLKRFEVISGQKIDNRWFLKQLRVERFDPASGKQVSRTYLDFS
jgi:hypothetical protein